MLEDRQATIGLECLSWDKPMSCIMRCGSKKRTKWPFTLESDISSDKISEKESTALSRCLFGLTVSLSNNLSF